MKKLLAKRVENKLISVLSKNEFDFLSIALGSISQILPHIEYDAWRWGSGIKKQKSVWWMNEEGMQRRAIGIRVYIPNVERYIETKIKRQKGNNNDLVGAVLDNTEFEISSALVTEIGKLWSIVKDNNIENVIANLLNEFNEYVVLSYLKMKNSVGFDLNIIVNSLKQLSEQSYENNTLSYGIIIHKRKRSNKNLMFPIDFENKKFKALSDGYKTAFLIDINARIISLMDIQNVNKGTVGEHFFPEWARYFANQCTKHKIGFTLNRQGDILYFENGNLKFSKRGGKWQYWNHSYIISMIKRKAVVQRVDKTILPKVVNALYRYSLDISFRHTGCLFIMLRNQKNITKIVKESDTLDSPNRDSADKEFEAFLRGKRILSLDRNVLLDLASIDGAVVISNHGKLLAYGAVLQTRNAKSVSKEVGSRSKAAISGSKFGLAIKVSADGGISFYQYESKFLDIN